MPSLSLQRWFTERATSLDEIERAHRSLRGSGPGVRAATLQINQAYTMLLSGQFQGYCRDFHEECSVLLTLPITNPNIRKMAKYNLSFGLKLDRANPNPGNIGSDFDRLGLGFWPLVLSQRSQNGARRAALEELNAWRNAIAHQDFAPTMLVAGRPFLKLARVQSWRGACDGLVRSFDDVMQSYIQTTTGTVPW